MLADEAGDIVAISMSPIPQSGPRYNVKDRLYFSELADGSKTSPYIDRPLQNRYDGAWTIPVAYRLQDTSGKFIGIANCAIPLVYFEDIFRGITSSSATVVRLYRADGALLASSFPEEPKQADHSFDSSPSFVYPAYIGGAAGHPELHQNKKQHILAVNEVPGAPLSVQVSILKDSVLALWYKELPIAVILSLVLDGTIALAAILAMRYIRSSTRHALDERNAARHDALTNLPNRTFFQEEIGRSFQQAKQTGAPFALFLIDLDYFKLINDTYGHRAGDQLLRIISDRLSINANHNVFLARLGGDEFAVILRDACDLNQVQEFGQSLIKELQKHFYIGDILVEIGVSIGVALALCDGMDPDTLFDRADLALYQAKSGGRGVLCRYNEKIHAAEIEKIMFIDDLSRAVATQKLEVFFQPIVNLKTQTVDGFEALLRWNDPGRGAISPARFIPVAEETGLIGPLGAWVLQEACHHAINWPAGIYVAVNLSPVQLRISDVYAQVQTALASSMLPAGRLVVEITETVQLTADGAGGILRRLRDLGVGVSLDDFGTGYASLSYLRSFPFDRIKIDQSFVREMGTSKESAAIVTTIVELASRLGCFVTGEGIETLQQLEILRSIGCTKGQGYLIGRPMPANKVAEYLASWVYPISTTVELDCA
ncbi:EAL domain-containing protein [Methylobacterium sp. J-088]|uniref:EAL domain-containing protein n=1 Tax=Methylobacterium sp. J-088 TaxID=2836664 RepID=UPI001FBB2DA8|nr:EAL domain-containing protein [Methylobacterium sp. J-088]MCJ2062979.1 EAL domain-containing protein [Methylobacterium sp. J-088]